ncbi:MAG TPA: LysM peptidoglycan-binding domain-containing protein, partial [Candidatus Paceibacterota bacterium]|nr:LysM peptidoglycan-binding domain-containing protein [Candidatus Paceibacterota bacterium]
MFVLPLFAYAGIFTFFSGLFNSNVEIQSLSDTNSQTIALLQAPVNSDPVLLAKGGGDISIVNGTALLPESGPNGSLADVGTETNQHGQISVYIVRAGDTLSQIAKMFDVTTNTIAWNNDIQRGVIRPGQTLVILPISGVQHTVKKGDTVASIAKLYRADADEVRQYNELGESAVLAVGTIIVVPDGELSPVATSPVTSNLRGAGGPEYAGYYMRPLLGGRKTQGLHGYNGVDIGGV